MTKRVLCEILEIKWKKKCPLIHRYKIRIYPAHDVLVSGTWEYLRKSDRFFWRTLPVEQKLVHLKEESLKSLAELSDRAGLRYDDGPTLGNELDPVDII